MENILFFHGSEEYCHNNPGPEGNGQVIIEKTVAADKLNNESCYGPRNDNTKGSKMNTFFGPKQKLTALGKEGVTKVIKLNPMIEAPIMAPTVPCKDLPL